MSEAEAVQMEGLRASVVMIDVLFDGGD